MHIQIFLKVAIEPKKKKTLVLDFLSIYLNTKYFNTHTERENKTLKKLTVIYI